MNDNKKYVDLPGLQDYDKGVKDALGKIQTKVNDLEGGVSELAGSMSYYYTKKETDDAIDDLRDEHINDIQDLQGDLDNKANKTHTHELSNITDFFMGSYKEYETAYAAGSIPVGALVIITDDNESDDATSPILGTGKLDSMILG